MTISTEGIMLTRFFPSRLAFAVSLALSLGTGHFATAAGPNVCTQGFWLHSFFPGVEEDIDVSGILCTAADDMLVLMDPQLKDIARKKFEGLAERRARTALPKESYWMVDRLHPLYLKKQYSRCWAVFAADLTFCTHDMHKP